ncbi:twin transmembrane helix small protein [Hyphobacterium sp. SN044]|uniref:twin transmembrane helix small protein n=1 Tax=Hyphobacterium sp. SN044 TaxID=2912575 RepID=UPI001F15E939|nr:twin transmembrane helix small protein [Hyphobacterium sp. SN044]MCF8879768.1 twin transmembrane helix small protein [Hyphobacterium sp. SN044]
MLLFVNIMIGVALLLVLVTLIAGLVNMTRGGDGSAGRSNVLMRWRVGLQFAAIALMVLGFIIRGAISG